MEQMFLVKIFHFIIKNGFINNIIYTKFDNIVAFKTFLDKLQKTNITKKNTPGLLASGSNILLDYSNGISLLQNESKIDPSKPIIVGFLQFTSLGGDGWTDLLSLKFTNSELDSTLSLNNFIKTPKLEGGLGGIISYPTLI